MQYSLAILALGAATAMAQGTSPEPAGCSTSFSGTFSFQTANISSSAKMARDLDSVLGRPVQRRQQSCGGSVTLTLKNGQLLDAKGRIGYIASNHQFQFDAPVQAGAITEGQWSVCGNGSLSLGDSAVFYNCLSGTFDNIYDEAEAAQCYPVTIDTFPCLATGAVASAATSQISPAGESTDGQVATSKASSVAATSATTTPASTSAPAATIPATPFPVAKNSSVIATGTGVTKAASPIASTTPAASAFKGAADVLAVGQGFVAMVAAAGAFFML